MSDDESAGDSRVKPPQTVDEMRRLHKRRMQNAQLVLKPYVGRRTEVVKQCEDVHKARSVSEQCVAASSTVNCSTSTSGSTSGCDTTDVHVESVKCHSSCRSSNAKTSKCQEDETAHSVSTDCLQKQKLLQYLRAVG